MFSDGFHEALELVLGGDVLVWRAAARSLWISSLAVAFAAMVGMPLGLSLARGRGIFTRATVLVLRGAMALPTVLVGTICYGLMSRQGVLGPLELLYSPCAIVLGEFVLAMPIVASLTHGAISSLDPRVDETIRSLAASPWLRAGTLISEARTGIVLAIVTALARCITELGIAMMVGGNIADHTRTLATATALETTRGEFGRGLAMGFILLAMALAITVLVAWCGRETKRYGRR